MIDDAYLDRLLSHLYDQDLGQWDRDFVSDMIDRLGEYGERLEITPRQQEQLNRLEDQYPMSSVKPAAGPGHNNPPADDVGGIAAGQLRAFIERIERLEEEKSDLQSDIKDVYAEAKESGFDIKIMRQIVRLRKMDKDDRDEQMTMIELYGKALGIW